MTTSGDEGTARGDGGEREGEDEYILPLTMFYPPLPSYDEKEEEDDDDNDNGEGEKERNGKKRPEGERWEKTEKEKERKEREIVAADEAERHSHTLFDESRRLSEGSVENEKGGSHEKKEVRRESDERRGEKVRRGSGGGGEGGKGPISRSLEEFSSLSSYSPSTFTSRGRWGNEDREEGERGRISDQSEGATFFSIDIVFVIYLFESNFISYFFHVYFYHNQIFSSFAYPRSS